MQVSCNIYGKNYTETYLEKHKNNAHGNKRDKINCEYGTEVYDLKHDLTIQSHFKTLITN